MLITREQVTVLCQEHPVQWAHASPCSGRRSGHRQNDIALYISAVVASDSAAAVDSSCPEPTLTHSLSHPQSSGRNYEGEVKQDLLILLI
jgi:hypothetical protein